MTVTALTDTGSTTHTLHTNRLVCIHDRACNYFGKDLLKDIALKSDKKFGFPMYVRGHWSPSNCYHTTV